MSVCTDQSVVFNYFLYMTREVELFINSSRRVC